MDTSTAYNEIITLCRELFLKKTKDYGTSWRIMRLSSITDQIFMKAQRIRTLEIKKNALVDEGVAEEYVGIINYCVIALIQLELGSSDARLHLDTEEVSARYDEKIRETYLLMTAKNHDYGEAWRDMRVSSLTDLILTKLHRVKQIEDNNGHTLVSEGLKANYQDILNYGVFALIKLGFAEKTQEL